MGEVVRLAALSGFSEEVGSMKLYVLISFGLPRNTHTHTHTFILVSLT